MQVDIDRDRAASLGITPDQIETALGAAFGGQQISQIYPPDRSVPGHPRIAAAISAGRLGSVAALSQGRGRSHGAADRGHQDRAAGLMPLTINHSGQIPSITISFDLHPGKR